MKKIILIFRFPFKEDQKAEFIRLSFGESQMDLQTLLPITVIYCLYFVLGLLGNIATCFVINNNEYMRYKFSDFTSNQQVTKLICIVKWLMKHVYSQPEAS